MVLRLIFIIVNSLYSFLDIKYVYIFILKFSDLSIFDFSFASMSDVFKGIDVKAFPRSRGNNIRFVIAILYSIFITLAFF